MKHIDFQYGVQYRPSRRMDWDVLRDGEGHEMSFGTPSEAARVVKIESGKPQYKTIFFRIVKRAVTPWEVARDE